MDKSCFIVSYLKHLALQNEEKEILTRAIQMRSAGVFLWENDAFRAKLILLLDTFIPLRLNHEHLAASWEETNSSSEQGAPPKDLKQRWKTYFYLMQKEVIVNLPFNQDEVDFLVLTIANDFLHQFCQADKAKLYGPFENKTFWGEVAMRFNMRFSTRMRSIVTLRNKMKNLLNNDERNDSIHLAPILRLLREGRHAGNSSTTLIEPIEFDPSTMDIDEIFNKETQQFLQDLIDF